MENSLKSVNSLVRNLVLRIISYYFVTLTLRSLRCLHFRHSSIVLESSWLEHLACLPPQQSMMIGPKDSSPTALRRPSSKNLILESSEKTFRSSPRRRNLWPLRCFIYTLLLSGEHDRIHERFLHDLATLMTQAIRLAGHQVIKSSISGSITAMLPSYWICWDSILSCTALSRPQGFDKTITCCWLIVCLHFLMCFLVCLHRRGKVRTS